MVDFKLYLDVRFYYFVEMLENKNPEGRKPDQEHVQG